MTDQEKQKLYTLRYLCRNDWGKPESQSEAIEILNGLLGDGIQDDARPWPVIHPPATPTVPKFTHLWLSAGHGGSDPGVCDGDLREADLAIELRDLVKARLVGLSVWTDPNEWKTSQTAPYLQSHTKAGELIADIHFNWGARVGHGVEVLTPVSPTVFEVNLAKKLAKAIAETLGSVLRGDQGFKTEAESQHKKLAMMRPAGENVLIEVCFLDNKAEIGRYLSRKIQVADAIANVFKTVLAPA